MANPIVTVTIRDCRVDTFRGSGAGGQKRNKTSSGVRVTHEPSGACGESEATRSQASNKRDAFRKMAESDRFQRWARIETMRRTGELAAIENEVDRQILQETKVEVHVEGKWVAPRYDEVFEDGVAWLDTL